MGIVKKLLVSHLYKALTCWKSAIYSFSWSSNLSWVVLSVSQRFLMFFIKWTKSYKRYVPSTVNHGFPSTVLFFLKQAWSVRFASLMTALSLPDACSMLVIVLVSSLCKNFAFILATGNILTRKLLSTMQTVDHLSQHCFHKKWIINSFS